MSSTVPVAAQREPADVALLTGDGARELIGRALAGQHAHLVDWQVHSVHHRPGAGVTVGYAATVERRGHEPAEEYLCATTARLSDPSAPGLIPVATPECVVHVWLHPADPELPGLATACDPARLSEWLGSPVAVELLAYRPTRRAVVHVTSTVEGEAYLKVVRPAAAPELIERHTTLTDAGVPAPRVLRTDPAGLVMLESGRGVPLANLLAQGLGDRAARVLDSLVSTLDALPAAVMDLPRHPAWAERVDHYAHAAATVLPEHADRTSLLAQGVGELMAASDPGPVAPSHGDYYEANVLMDPRPGALAVSTLLDVDSVGPGHRVDDLACMLGHVSVLPHLAPQAYPYVPEVLETWTQACSAMVDDVALHARCAAVVLSLVAGARRTDGGHWRSDAEGRLARAEAWLARGRELLAMRTSPR